MKQTELGFTSNFYNPFRKNKKTVSFANYKRIKKASETPTDYSSIIKDFLSADTRKDFIHLEEKFCLNGFEFKKKTEDYILIYRTVFNSEIHFPSIKECIRIDRNIHLQLLCDGNPIPLPQWFIHRHNAKLKRFCMLENFPNYIHDVVEEHLYSILKELQKLQDYKELIPYYCAIRLNKRTNYFWKSFHSYLFLY